jgi:shikimate kinase
MAERRIVLVGFMGAGKSTVGPLLAEALGRRFVDSDRRIEEGVGLSVPEIFSHHGEAAFRAHERRVALELAGAGPIVLAAGGGAFADPETRQALQRDALTVWLRAPLEVLMARLPQDGSRPLAGSRERMAQLLAARESSYRLADLIVDASPSAAEVVRVIVEAVTNRDR